MGLFYDPDRDSTCNILTILRIENDYYGAYVTNLNQGNLNKGYKKELTLKEYMENIQVHRENSRRKPLRHEKVINELDGANRINSNNEIINQEDILEAIMEGKKQILKSNIQNEEFMFTEQELYSSIKQASNIQDENYNTNSDSDDSSSQAEGSDNLAEVHKMIEKLNPFCLKESLSTLMAMKLKTLPDYSQTRDLEINRNDDHKDGRISDDKT